MKQTFKQFLNESVLYVFDVDGTLFNTSALIRIIKNGKLIHRLNHQEYNEYKLKNGETFDYSEFQDAEKFANESRPINNIIQILIKANISNSKVIINTGRGEFDNEKQFHDTLKNQGIDVHTIPTHRAEKISGNESTAKKKLIYIQRYLDNKRYADVFMYDDLEQNLSAFLTLKDEYPKTRFHAFLVSKNGHIHQFK